VAEFKNDLVQAFIGSTLITLKLQCKLEVKHTGTFNKGEKRQTPFVIGGMIGITNPSSKGAAILCFPKTIFLQILRQLLIDESITEITRDNEDAAAEILNIIFSQVKTALNKNGHHMQMAIPSVIRGTQVESYYPKNSAVSVIGFEANGEEFYVELLSTSVEEKDKVPATTHDKEKLAALHSSARTSFAMEFIKGTMHTFEVQFGLKLKPGKPFERDLNKEYPFDIGASVGVTSNTLNGSFMIVFSEQVFLKLASKMFNETITTFQPELDDLAAEIANMALGTAKKVLNQQGHGIQMAIPTIIRGSQIQSNQPKGRKFIVVPFQCDIGDFMVEIDVQS
jgi:chemotaxis protein CheX